MMMKKKKKFVSKKNAPTSFLSLSPNRTIYYNTIGHYVAGSIPRDGWQ